MHYNREPEPGWSFEPGRRRGPGLFKVAVVAVSLALFAWPFLPEGLRVTVPASWRLRLPRVEVVREGAGHEPGQQAGADMAPALEPDAGKRPSIGHSLPLDAIGIDGRGGRGASRPARPTPTRRTRRAPRRVVRPPLEDADELGDVTYVPDSPVTLIPMRVRTEIRLSSASDRDAAEAAGAARPAPANADPTRLGPASVDGAADEDWPLLCGQVVDASGAPVAGARVELESPRLTVRTDPKGRFCVACPTGERTVRIDGAGRGRATRVVALAGSLFEMRIALSPAR